MTTSLPQLDGHNLKTHSEMSTYKACQRRWYFAYILGWRSEHDKAALRFGSNVHAGLDWLRKDALRDFLPNAEVDQMWIDGAIAVATKPYDDIPRWCETAENADYDWQIERVKVAELIRGYAWRWSKDSITVLESERAFDLPIRNPETGAHSTRHRFGGKIDSIIRLADGRVGILETKTTSDDIQSDDYWGRLHIDSQISGYLTAARALGHDAQVVLYDVIRKPVIRPCQVPELDPEGRKIVLDRDNHRVFKANREPRQTGDAEKGFTLVSRLETPDEYANRLGQDILDRPDNYYARREIARTDGDLAEFADELWQVQQQMAESENRGRHFRNTNHCQAYNTRCEYLDLCINGHKASDGLPSGFRQLESVHPELQT